jgi:hypothetical protein
MRLMTLTLLIATAPAWAFKSPIPRGKTIADLSGQQLRQTLTDHHLGGGWDEASLNKVIRLLGVRLHESTERLSAHERFIHYNRALDSLTRLPLALVERMKSRGKPLNLVAGVLTDHPAMAPMRGKTPRGWPEGRTWEEVPGAATHQGAVIVVDSQFAGHGAANLILHEIGHTVDYYHGRGRLSESQKFKRLHEATPFSQLYSSSYTQHREENFAELFALYFQDRSSRENLRRQFPEAHTYLAEMFPDAPHTTPARAPRDPGLRLPSLGEIGSWFTQQTGSNE